MKTSFWFAKPAAILLKDDRFILGKRYYDSLLADRYIRKYEICRLKLSDIKRNRNPKITFEDKKPHKAFHADGKDAYFKELISSLDEKGYDERYMLVVDYDNMLLDGNHRRVWLYAKYGPDFEVDVLKIDRTSTPIFSKNMLIKLLCNIVPIKSMRQKLRRKYGIQH